MKLDWKDHVFRFAMTALLSLGLLAPLLLGLQLSAAWGALVLSVLAVSLALEALSLHPKFRLPGILLLALLLLLGLLPLGGLAGLQNLFRALSLHLSGVPGALPLVKNEAVLFLSLGVTVLCFLCARKTAGGVPALLLCITVLLILWLADRFTLVWFHLPALFAALLLLLTDAHPELPPLRLAPWIAGLSLLCVLLTPPSGVVSPTLKAYADHLRQQILDRLFYTEPRDVFSLLTEGYYPQGSGQLGGPANPTDHPVMQVSTPRLTYLRGVALNDYDGRCWRNTLGGRRYLWDSPSTRANRQHLFDLNLPAAGLNTSLLQPVSVSVRMLSDGTSTLFVPQRIRSLRAGGELVPYFSNASEIFITRNLQPGDTWSVSAPLFLSGDAGLDILIDSAAGAEDPFWPQLQETYTALPSHLEEPVWEMALEVTAPHETPYAKAFALQSFLSRSYRYTLEAEKQPSNVDFVTNFLFNTGEGYCTYFASAMTVLCRMAGLPARYVEGYLAQPNAQGEALVTGLDAHAWTEVYFKGFGWVTFDATPRSASLSGGTSEDSPQAQTALTPPPDAMASQSPEELTPSPNPDAPTPTPLPDTATPTPDPDAEGNPELQDPRGTASGGFPLWLILLLLLLVCCLLLLLRWHWTSPAYLEKKAADPAAAFDVWLRETVRRLTARNLPRRPGETPMSYTRRLDAQEDLPLQLSPLGECVSLMKYGRATPGEADLQLARDAALLLRRDQKPSVRLRFALLRLRRLTEAGRSPTPAVHPGIRAWFGVVSPLQR